MRLTLGKSPLLAAVAVVSMLTAAEARAEGFVVPFIGINFGGDTGRSFDVDFDTEEIEEDINRAAFGAVVGYMGGGIFGAELDVAYTRNFFGSGPSVEGNSLLTVMPAFIVGIPIGGQSGGGFRPYGFAGAGIIRRDLDIQNFEVFDDTDMAYTFGGGVMVFFSDLVGIRAEYRYLRNFEVDTITFNGVDVDRGTFNYSRASFGVIFRF